LKNPARFFSAPDFLILQFDHWVARWIAQAKLAQERAYPGHRLIWF